MATAPSDVAGRRYGSQVAREMASDDEVMGLEPRSVQTFVFADLAGFTALTEAHGDLEAADLAADFCDRVAALGGDYGAKALKTIGDAVLLRVERAHQAIALGLAIVALPERLEGYTGVRVGMDSGPAIERAGEWIGGTINIAARVSAAARAGEVLLTAATQELAAPDLGDVELETVGERRLRNLARPVRLYRARPRGAPTDPLDVDPVCRMTLPPGRGVKLEFGGMALRFCSLECAGLYSADPDSYDAGR